VMRVALVPLAVLAIVGCEPGPPATSQLAISPPTSLALDPEALTHNFRLGLRLGERGLEPGDAVELWLFPARQAPLSSVVMLDGASIEGKLHARAVLRSSVRADEPGGSAVLRIDALTAIEAGQHLEMLLEVPKLPQQGYGLSGPAELSMPLRILRAATGELETFDGARWPLQPEQAARLVLRLPSELEPGDEAPLVVNLLSKEGYPARAARGPVELSLPPGVSWVRPLHAFDEADAGVQTARLRFTAPGLYRLEGSAGSFRATSNPVWVRKSQTTSADEGALSVNAKTHRNVYWGDLHNHSRYSFDSRNRNLTAVSIGESLDFARGASLLDFIAMTDHGPNGAHGENFEVPTQTDMSPEDWASYSAELASARVPGLHVFAGFEHLGARGHTCLIFRDVGDYFIEEGRRLPLADIWQRSAPGSLLSIPHLHPLQGMAAFEGDSPHETLIEVHSKWGSYEFYENPDPNKARRRGDGEERAVHDRGQKGPFVRGLLGAGKRYGFVGASDHGPPGQYGLTAVLAKAPTREAIFDALLARRTWVTTGPRTWLEFYAGGGTFGEQLAIAPGDPRLVAREIRLSVNAALPIERVEIIRNGEVWRSEVGEGRTDVELTWRDETPLAKLATERSFANTRSAEYYARVVLGDGQMAWGSPVFFELTEGIKSKSGTQTDGVPQ
jgi:hypothetical protein